MLARHKAIRQRDVDKANALADAAKAAKIAAVMLVKSSEAREKVIRRRRAEEAAAKAKATAEEEAAAQALAAKEAALILMEGPQMEAEDHDVPPPRETTTAGATREEREGSSSSIPEGYVYDGESDAARARRAFRAVLGPPRGERGGGGGLEADWEHTAALLAAAGVPLAEDDVRDTTITRPRGSTGAESTALTPIPSPLALTRAAQVIAVEFPDPAHRLALCSMSELSHLLPIAHLASHFFRLDEDGNGTLSVSELVSAANAILGDSNSTKSTLSKRNNNTSNKSSNEGSIAITTNDIDNDNNDGEPVGTQELLGSLSEALCANLLEQMDSDSDGRVDLAEFVHFFRCVIAVRLCHCSFACSTVLVHFQMVTFYDAF